MSKKKYSFIVANRSGKLERLSDCKNESRLTISWTCLIIPCHDCVDSKRSTADIKGGKGEEIQSQVLQVFNGVILIK